MHRFEAFLARPFRVRVVLSLMTLGACVLSFGAVAGQARSTDTPPPAVREHDRGHWFRHVCSQPDSRFAWCGAQVVTSSTGLPLASSSPPSGAFTPSAFHTAYSVPTTSVAGTPTIAIVDAYNDPNIEADLAAYSQQFGLPACTTANGCFRRVDQNGGTSYPSGTSWHLEIALDVEIAHAMCQNCRILLVEAASSSLQNLGTAVNTAVALGASVVSNSYGGSEFSGETSYETAYYKHPGVAITASSGDSGYGVEFPAASQYVTAVGGTTLAVNADKTYKSETVWSGAGSGCSAYEPKPSWQSDTGCPKRSVTDVSADADPNSGAAIYDSVGTSGGQAWYQVGGTSLAAPLVGAVYALTGTTTTYGSAPYGHATSLNDVVSGTNGSCTPAYLCTGGTGYDGPTGLGTPRGLGAFGGGSAPAPDFALAVTPSSATVVQGKQATYTVSVSPTNGFTGTVAFSASGLPSSATAGFSPTGSTTGSTLTVSTAASLAAGTYPFTITGTSGSLSHNTAATLVVTPAATADFALSASPASQSVLAGGKSSYPVTITPSNGFSGSVTLTVTGAPSGATATFTTNPATSSSTLNVTTSSQVTAGSYPLAITGKSGSLSHTASVTLVVQDFSLSLSPGSQTVAAGASATYSVPVTPAGGFAGSVTLSASGLPSGAGASFNPNPPTTSSTLTITTAAGVPAGSYPFTVTGTSGSLVHTTAGTLVVTSAGGTGAASLSVSPTTARRGSNVTVTWSGVASPSTTDWIGLFAQGAPNTAYLSYEYDSTCRAGFVSSATSSGSCSFRLPNQPGTYELRLMANNGYTPIVSGVLVVAT